MNDRVQLIQDTFEAGRRSRDAEFEAAVERAQYAQGQCNMAQHALREARDRDAELRAKDARIAELDALTSLQAGYLRSLAPVVELLPALFAEARSQPSFSTAVRELMCAWEGIPVELRSGKA